MTVSVLKGEDGFQRKEIHKLIDWIKSEPPPDVINLPYSLLLGLAGPLKASVRIDRFAARCRERIFFLIACGAISQNRRWI